MTDVTRSTVEDALDRAEDLPEEEALAVLQSAREDLAALDERDGVDDRRALEDRLDQRIREVEERGAYDSGIGAAMEPDEEDAP